LKRPVVRAFQKYRSQAERSGEQTDSQPILKNDNYFLIFAKSRPVRLPAPQQQSIYQRAVATFFQLTWRMAYYVEQGLFKMKNTAGQAVLNYGEKGAATTIFC
jgi:hypothetical protein